MTSTSTSPRPCTALPVHQLAGLRDAGYTVGTVRHDLDVGLLGSNAWQDLADSWSNLPQDTFMADGGTYRRRRYSELVCDSTSGDIDVESPKPFSQPRSINPLNGGVERWFEPIEPGTLANPAFRSIVLWWVRSFAAIDGPGCWRAQCFQNRTLARPDDPGLPTPEGIHRDGMDFNVVLIVDRQGVSGGTSRLYDGESRALLGEHLLAEPGDHVAMDDRRLLHDTTSVRLATDAPADATGHRDALVASFAKVG